MPPAGPSRHAQLAELAEQYAAEGPPWVVVDPEPKSLSPSALHEKCRRVEREQALAEVGAFDA